MNVVQPTEDGLIDVVKDSLGEKHWPTLYMHLECWETWRDEVTITWNDKPTMDGADPVFVCNVCTSLIGRAEMFMAATLGEFHHQYRPGIGTGPKFVANGVPKLACVICVAAIEEYFDQWAELRDMAFAERWSFDEEEEDDENE